MADRADGRLARLRGDGALPVRCADTVGVRHDVHAVRHVLHARLGLDVAAWRAHPHGHVLRRMVAAPPRARRRGVLRAVFPPGDAGVPGSWRRILLEIVPAERADRYESVAPDRLAVQVRAAADGGAVDHPGRVRIDQEHSDHRAQGTRMISPEWMGIVALAVLFGAIFVGFPIAFTLISVAMFFGYIALGDLSLYLMQLQFFGVMRDPTLASVPFFLFMGYLLEQSGLMERLFRGVQLLFAS